VNVFVLLKANIEMSPRERHNLDEKKKKQKRLTVCVSHCKQREIFLKKNREMEK
jgi:hypothetical protein